MLPTALCLALLAQTTPPLSEEPLNVAVPALKLIGLDDKLADFYAGHLAQQLSFHGIRTVTSSELAALIGLERQKQLLGCDSDSCKADLVSSLGVDGILVGTVTKLDKSYQLDVRIVSAKNGQTLAGASANSGDNDALVGTFTVVAEQLAEQMAKKLNRKLNASAATLGTRASTVKRFSWLPAAAGGVAAIVGGVFLGLSRGSYARLSTPPLGPPLDMATTEATAVAGATQQTVGWVMVGAGIACVAGAAAMFFLGGDETVTAGIALAPGGATFALTGVWP